MRVQGKRRDFPTDAELPELWEYGKRENKWWYCATPGGMADLSKHDVIEHEDGTITVSPSIAVTTPQSDASANFWHGFLEHGIFREA